MFPMDELEERDTEETPAAELPEAAPPEESPQAVSADAPAEGAEDSGEADVVSEALSPDDQAQPIEDDEEPSEAVAESQAAPQADDAEASAADEVEEAEELEKQEEQTEQEAQIEGSAVEDSAAPQADEDEEQAVSEEADQSLAVADEGEGEVEQAEEEPDDDRAWYVVHCYSGYENKVRHNLEQRIESMGMKGLIFDVVVPTEEEIEVKDGKRRTVERRVFPGYILVNMILTEESWYVVRNTPGVTSFVGMGNEPVPLRPEEVSQIVKRMEADAPRIKVTFRNGERVRIVDGPFNDFHGTVDEIDMERAKVRVLVNFFGRETPVELDFLQVEKA